MVRSMTDFLFPNSSTPPVLIAPLHIPPEEDKSSGICRELGKLFSKVRSGRYSVLNTQPLKTQIEGRYPQYSGSHQHDAHELLIVLLDHIHESARGLTSEEGIPADCDFVVDGGCLNTPRVLSGGSLTAPTAPTTTPMNISPPKMTNIAEHNLNR
eukprot:sb/3473208/